MTDNPADVFSVCLETGGGGRGSFLTNVGGDPALRLSARCTLQDQSRSGASDLAQTCARGPDVVVGDDGLEEAEGAVWKNIFVRTCQSDAALLTPIYPPVWVTFL